MTKFGPSSSTSLRFSNNAVHALMIDRRYALSLAGVSHPRFGGLAAIWCQLHGIHELAIGTLKSNPFEDASALFFDQLGQVCSSVGPSIRFWRPFAKLEKSQVMELGRTFPLGSTFSCISPRNGLHCGQCSKCAERRAAFRLINRSDPTHYSHEAARGSKTVPQFTIHDSYA